MADNGAQGPPPGPERTPRRLQALLLVIGVALAAALVAGLALATFLRVGLWRSDVALFSDAVANDPENANTRCLLGVALVAEGRVEAGEAELLRAASGSLEPPRNGRWIVPLALMAAGGARELQGDMRGAEALLKASVELARPRELDVPTCALAGFYVRRGAREKARAALLHAIERDPGAGAVRDALKVLDAEER